MYFEDYSAKPIQANIVPKEGRYEIKVNEIYFNKKEDPKRYTRVDCIVNAPGYPHISIFLTEGPSFDAQATAFYDTFNIQRGNTDMNAWKGKKGWIDITIKTKDGYQNMIPHYILDSNGYVMQNRMQYSGEVNAVKEAFQGEVLPDDYPF